MKAPGWLLLLLFVTPWAARAALPAYEVPPVAGGLSADGSADWADQGFRVDQLVADPTTADGPSPRLRLGWDARGLWVLVVARDATPVEAGAGEALWTADCVELFVNTGPGTSEQFQVVIAPGRDPRQPALRQMVIDRRRSGGRALEISVSRQVMPDGYRLTVLLPWSNLSLQPRVGLEIGFQAMVRDRDPSGATVARHWYPQLGTHQDTGRSHRLRLATAASAPVRLAATAQVEHFRRVLVQVVAAPELAGRPVVARHDRRKLGTAELRPGTGQATVTLRLPLPPAGRPYDSLVVAAADEAPTPVLVPDIDALRRSTFDRAEVRFRPFVFTGAGFPPVDFAQPNLVEDVAGPYTIATRFYAADYQLVTKAAKPGRYGAVVEVTTAGGWRLTRRFTLYRQPEPVNWWRERLTASVTLPAGLGIAPEVLREQSATVAETLKWLLDDGCSREPDVAALLAGLSEAPVGHGFARAGSADARWWYGLQRKLGELAPYRYLVNLPQAYAAAPQRRWPLVVFLHGSGERGDDLDRVKVHGPPKLAAAGRDFPFVLISPQCPPGTWWSPWLVRDLIDEVCSRYRIDRARLYLTGLSMGGFGTWETAFEFPDLLAAVVPLCGGGTPEAAALIRHLPVWVFHGAKDGAVPVEFSQDMVAALRQVGSAAKLTIYPEAGHDCWTETYANDELYRWLLAQRRRGR